MNDKRSESICIFNYSLKRVGIYQILELILVFNKEQRFSSTLLHKRETNAREHIAKIVSDTSKQEFQSMRVFRKIALKIPFDSSK